VKNKRSVIDGFGKTVVDSEELPKVLNLFVYAAAAAVKIKRSKYMFGYRKKIVCYSWVPPFTALQTQ
jgi:hypothetical protein